MGRRFLRLPLPLAAALIVGCFLFGSVTGWLWPTVLLLVFAWLVCLAVMERRRGGSIFAQRRSNKPPHPLSREASGLRGLGLLLLGLFAALLIGAAVSQFW